MRKSDAREIMAAARYLQALNFLPPLTGNGVNGARARLSAQLGKVHPYPGAVVTDEVTRKERG